MATEKIIDTQRNSDKGNPMDFEFLTWPFDDRETQFHAILLHGYGADAWDLAGLVEAPISKPSKGVRFWFLQGPEPVHFGPYHRGRAWWPIPNRWLENPLLADWPKHPVPGLDELIQRLEDWRSTQKLVPEKTFIGGFSQGAITSLWWSWLVPHNWAGVIAFSPTLTDLPRGQSLWSIHPTKPPIWISHGRLDPVLPVSLTRQLVTELRQKQWPISYHEFDGTHEIPQFIWEKAVQFMNQKQS